MSRTAWRLASVGLIECSLHRSPAAKMLPCAASAEMPSRVARLVHKDARPPRIACHVSLVSSSYMHMLRLCTGSPEGLQENSNSWHPACINSTCHNATRERDAGIIEIFMHSPIC